MNNNAEILLPTPLPPLPEPVGFRTRYRSEPGMIGHYPWTYADYRRRKYDRPECEYENLFTAEQVAAAVAAERERWHTAFDEARDAILNERDPLEGEGASSDVINAVLGILDDAFAGCLSAQVPAVPAQGK